VTTPDRPSVPTRIPDDMQERYAADARRRVLASKRLRRRAAPRGRAPSRAVRLPLWLATLCLAAAFGIAASSWLIGLVMLIALVLLVGLGVKVTALIRGLSAPRGPRS
jgi:fatty acid desaturase